jgi:hypothetical protein
MDQKRPKKACVSKKAQAQVPAFHAYVLARLVGIYGTSFSDVVARVIGFWIHDNEAALLKLGISLEDWKRTLDAEASPLTNVIEYPARSRKGT